MGGRVGERAGAAADAQAHALAIKALDARAALLFPGGMTKPGTLIAIVGSDGSGKSTVGAALLAWLRTRGPAELCHLGKQSGNLGRAAARLPFVGGGMERRIDKELKQAGEGRAPGAVATLLIYAFTMRRVARFRRMLRHRARGITILADRFPQLSHPAAIDGPGFARVRVEGPLATRLAAAERRHFERMTAHAPDLVIRLLVDLDTAVARKPDHRPAQLAEKIAAVGSLTFGAAPIVDIDATRPLGQVIADAEAAIAALPPR